MRSRSAKRATAVCAALVVLCACSKAKPEPDGPHATLGTEPPRTTTTDPYAIPSVIDAAYVNRVLAGLDGLFGDGFRLLISSRSVTPEFLQRFRAVYGNRDLLNNQLTIVQGNLKFDLQKIPADPGNKRTTVAELLSATPLCVFARVDRDYSAFSGKTSPIRTEWIALAPLDFQNDPNHYNSTGWSYIYEGFDQNGDAPKTSPCARSS